MADYRTITPQRAVLPLKRGCGPFASLLYVQLLVGTLAQPLPGLIFGGPLTIADAMFQSDEQVQLVKDALDELRDKGLAEVDAENRVVRIVGVLEDHVKLTGSPESLRGWLRVAKNAPASRVVLAHLDELLGLQGQASSKSPTAQAEAWREIQVEATRRRGGLSVSGGGLPGPLVGPVSSPLPGTLAGGPVHKQEQEHQQEQEQEQPQEQAGLGERLITIRGCLGLQPWLVDKKASLPRGLTEAIEGGRELPGRDELQRLARELGVPELASWPLPDRETLAREVLQEHHEAQVDLGIVSATTPPQALDSPMVRVIWSPDARDKAMGLELRAAWSMAIQRKAEECRREPPNKTVSSRAYFTLEDLASEKLRRKILGRHDLDRRRVDAPPSRASPPEPATSERKKL